MPLWIVLLLAFLLFDLVLVIWIFFKRSGPKLDSKSLQYIKSHWIRIIDMASGNPNASILDADKLLDYTLGRHGFDGSLGEKLKKGRGKFSDLNGVWRAHKLRNRVAHEMVELQKSEVADALAQFKKGLNDLGAQL